MKKAIICFLILLISISLLVFTSVSCKAGTAETTVAATTATETTAAATTTTETKKVWKIGFNNYMDSFEFCALVHQSMEKAAEEYGVELIAANGEMDGAKMIANTQTFIDEGCDLIIDFNWVPEVGATMVDMCNEAGIKLISMDSIYEGAYYFGVDAYSAGKLLGEWAAPVIIEKWDGQIDAILAIMDIDAGPSVTDRVKGDTDYLQTVEGIIYPKPEMVFTFDSGTTETEDAKRIATDFLTAHPDLKHILILTHNDETALGAYAGVESSERLEDCILLSQGGGTPFKEHIQAGGGDVWMASVNYGTEDYGPGVIPMAVDILEGKDVPMSVALKNVVLTKDNLYDYYPELKK